MLTFKILVDYISACTDQSDGPEDIEEERHYWHGQDADQQQDATRDIGPFQIVLVTRQDSDEDEGQSETNKEETACFEELSEYCDDCQ